MIAVGLVGNKGRQTAVEACASEQLGMFLSVLRRRLWRTVLLTDPLNPLWYRLSDVPRLVRRWLQPTGLFVVVLGPDGVGKSTIISELVNGIGRAFRRAHVYHWRPRLVWPGRRTPVTDPNAQKPHSPVRSVMRLLAHALDYQVGYWLRIRPSLVRSGLIVFDRYFDDIIADPRRYRYGGPLWLVRMIRFLIPKPDLLLVMDAPGEVIYSRKSELSLCEIARQRRIYRELVNEPGIGFMINAAQRRSEVAVEAARVVTDYLKVRFERNHRRWISARQQPGKLVPSALQAFAGPSAGVRISTTPLGHSGEVGRRRQHAFAVIPFRDSARCLLPLHSRPAALAGLKAYTPYTLGARLSKACLLHLIKAGSEIWARHRVLVHSEEPLEIESLVRHITGERSPRFALWLGSASRYRKLTIHVMHPSGETVGYIKLPLTRAATERIRREAAVLERLSNYKALEGRIPKVLHAGKWGEGYLLFQSAGHGRSGPDQFGAIHREFLRILASVQRIEVPGSYFVEQIGSRWDARSRRFEEKWERLAQAALRVAQRELRGVMVGCGISHGDFAPWNTRVIGDQLFVFDWEMAEWEAPLCWDSFHFDLSVSSLLSKSARVVSRDLSPESKGMLLLYLLHTISNLLSEQSDRPELMECREQMMIKLLRHTETAIQ